MHRNDIRLFVARWHNAMRSKHAEDESRQALDDYEARLQELLESRGHLRKLEDCYERFATTAKLPGLGAAFFTKLLYFAGYRRGNGGIQPFPSARSLRTGAVEGYGHCWPRKHPTSPPNQPNAS